MPPEENSSSILPQARLGLRSAVVIAVFGFAALIGTFALALSNILPAYKTAAMLIILAVYAVAWILFLRSLRQTRNADRLAAERLDLSLSAASQRSQLLTTDIEDRLFALEEANLFFGSSLKPSDMFRLVVSRVDEIFPLSAALLLFRDDANGKIRIAQADGTNADALRHSESDLDKGLASLVFGSGELRTDAELRLERETFSADALGQFSSSAAIPLFDKGEVFGVLQFFFEEAQHFDEASEAVLDAVGERVGPLFIGSFAFERTLSNALTDKLTNLPNERAFFMILENQLAESQRYRDERPLAIAAIDIKGFAEINKHYGHSTGDTILSFVAEQISVQLRKMDFLARSVNDEFLLILPTAGEKTVKEILDRIERSFVEHGCVITEEETVRVGLNFGSAAFWTDGETAQQLLRTAQMRKHQSKAMEPAKVIWFPKEYVN